MTPRVSKEEVALRVEQEKYRLANSDVRYFRRELKQANKERGKQGQTIYELRNEVAGLRERLKMAERAFYVEADAHDELKSKYYDAMAPAELPAPDQGTIDKMIEIMAAPPNNLGDLA